ncbi:unnamed protein product [Acanthosepion pharaonis]|uniref:Uncharacterized protein n=1 Tax=Acanthosepion pharaonis TaxID=158019 RepID=A0A812BPG0_ACAPH|nr:unnamed protein product [Sepia pharaonis]
MPPPVLLHLLPSPPYTFPSYPAFFLHFSPTSCSFQFSSIFLKASSILPVFYSNLCPPPRSPPSSSSSNPFSSSSTPPPHAHSISPPCPSKFPPSYLFSYPSSSFSKLFPFYIPILFSTIFNIASIFFSIFYPKLNISFFFSAVFKIRSIVFTVLTSILFFSPASCYFLHHFLLLFSLQKFLLFQFFFFFMQIIVAPR